MSKTIRVGLLATFFLSPVCHTEAQQAKRIFRRGYLTVSSLSAEASRIEAFRRGLRDLGYVEGQNIAIEQRSAADMYERLPALADGLIRIKVDFIISGGASATRVAQT